MNTPREVNGIVYKIPCECDKYYVGQSCKKLSKRIEQHKYAIRRDNMSNAINRHTHECSAPILWNKSEVLFNCTDFTLRNILESAFISVGDGQNFNNSLGIFKLDPLFLHTVTLQYKFKRNL